VIIIPFIIRHTIISKLVTGFASLKVSKRKLEYLNDSPIKRIPLLAE